MIKKITNKKRLLLCLAIFIALGILYYFTYNLMNPCLELLYLVGIVALWTILLYTINNNKIQKPKSPNSKKLIAYIILIPVGSIIIYILKFSSISNKKEIALIFLITITITFIVATIYKIHKKTTNL